MRIGPQVLQGLQGQYPDLFGYEAPGNSDGKLLQDTHRVGVVELIDFGVRYRTIRYGGRHGGGGLGMPFR